MPRPRELPTEDCLLSAAEAGAICKVSRSRFDCYVKRFPLLIRGRRLVQVTPGGRGTMRYLKSAVIAHLHLELTAERKPTREADDAVASAEQEAS